MMNHDMEDALKVLGRVADAFDHPSLREMYKGLTLSSIKTHRPQTSYSSRENQMQRARFGRYDESLDASYIYDDVKFTRSSSSSTDGSLSCGESCNEPSSLPEQTMDEQGSAFDITKMLLASSPLDRLNYLARVELKKTGWFERTDQWTVVNMGLSDLPYPVTPEKRERAEPADYAIFPRPIMVAPMSESPPPFPPRSENSFPYPIPPGIDVVSRIPAKNKHHHQRDTEGQELEHDLDLDLDTFESNFPDFSTPSYEKSIHVDVRSKPHKRFGRVKTLVRRMLSPSSHGSGHGHGGVGRSATTGRRTPSRNGEQRASWTMGGWTPASTGSTPHRWSGLWH